MNVATIEHEITPEMVELRVSSKEGFNAAYENNNFIILNTTLTEELIKEGIVRELISKVQNLRKEKNFEITDRICLYISGSKEIMDIVNEYQEMIKNEVLAVAIEEKDNLSNDVDLNGNKVWIDVEVKA